MDTINSIRKKIGSRLKYELKRRGLDCSADLGVPEDVLRGYLKGSRQIKFSELTTICNHLGVNPVRLIYSENYPELNIVFRNVRQSVQKTVSLIEDVFLLLESILPKLNVPQLNVPQYNHINSNKLSSIKDIISEAATYASRIRKKHSTPEKFISYYSIPLFPVRYNDEFDAFIITKDDRAVICINMDKTPQRIRFSLAHEICHLLFDRQNVVTVDVFLPNLYWKDRFTSDEIPEIFAYKFAEFYLLPYEEVHSVTIKWPELDLSKCQKLINNYKISKDVLANAIYDVLLCRNISVNIKNVKSILEPITSCKNTSNITFFLENERNRLLSLIKSHSSKYSDKILNFINEVLKFDTQ